MKMEITINDKKKKIIKYYYAFVTLGVVVFKHAEVFHIHKHLFLLFCAVYYFNN